MASTHFAKPSHSAPVPRFLYTSVLVALLAVASSGFLHRSHAASSPKYSIAALPSPAHDNYSVVSAMNDRGDVAGYYPVNAFDAEAIEWLYPAHRARVLGIPPRSVSAHVAGINNRGFVAVTGFSRRCASLPARTVSYAGRRHAVCAYANRPYVAVPALKKVTWFPLPGLKGRNELFLGAATAIASNNDVSGYMILGVQTVPVLWRFLSGRKHISAASWKLVLNPLPAGTRSGEALTTTGHPSFKAGGYVDASGTQVAALWDDRGSSQKMVPLPFPAGPKSRRLTQPEPGAAATTIPAMIAVTTPSATRLWLLEPVGTIPGTSFVRELDCYSARCRLGATQRFRGTDLSSLTVVDNRPVAVGSANNEAVLAEWKGPLPAAGVQPPANGKLVNLNRAIPSGTGWTLNAAKTINELGLIAGNATHNGLDRPFLLTPRR